MQYAWMGTYVLTQLSFFPVVWVTFLVNSPHDPPFDISLARARLIRGRQSVRVTMAVQTGEEFWGVRIEHTGGHNEWSSMDNLQVRSLPVSLLVPLLTSV
jgi:hypothetical protein